MASEADLAREELRARLTTEVRPIRVEPVHERDRPYSRGFVVTVEQGPHTSIRLEINGGEAQVLRDALDVLLREVPPPEE